MNDSVSVFMPYFEAMVEDEGLQVSPEQVEGVKFLIKQQVTADNAAMISTAANFPAGTDTLYVKMMQYCVNKSTTSGSSVEDTEDTENTITCPHCGGVIEFRPQG